MFEIYATISCVLILTGAVSAAYFAQFFKGQKDVFLWTAMIESIITMLIGVLYIYGAILWSKNEPQSFEFINNIDDLAIINSTYGSNEEQFINPDQFSTFENSQQFGLNFTDADNRIEDTRENNNFKLNIDHLMKYQYIIKTIINQKMQNKSFPTRKSKQIQMIETGMSQTDEIENLFTKTFFQHALFMYSFLYCAMVLVNYSNFCYSYIPETKKKTKPEKVCEVVSVSDQPDNQVFQKCQVLESAKPPVHLFSVKAKSESPTDNVTAYTNSDKTPNRKLFVIVCTEICCLIIATVVLYIILKSVKNDLPIDVPLDIHSFNATIADDNELKTVIHHMNNNQTKQEIDNIIKKIYNLIDTRNYNAAYVDSNIKGYFKYKAITSDYNEGVKQNVSLKVYKFVLYIIVYVIVLLYTNTVQTKFSDQNHEKYFKKCFMLFALLWLPAILEMFHRSYIINKTPNILSGLLLLLGNGNAITQTLQKYKQWIEYTKHESSVEPLYE